MMITFLLSLVARWVSPERRRKLKKITITITEKKDTDDVSINLDMKEQKSATKNENVAASNVYHAIEEKLKELENIK